MDKDIDGSALGKWHDKINMRSHDARNPVMKIMEKMTKLEKRILVQFLTQYYRILERPKGEPCECGEKFCDGKRTKFLQDDTCPNCCGVRGATTETLSYGGQYYNPVTHTCKACGHKWGGMECSA